LRVTRSKFPSCGDVNDSSDIFSFRTITNNVQTFDDHNDSLDDLFGVKAIHDVVFDLDVLINESDDFAIVGDDVDDFVRSHLLVGKSAKFENSLGNVTLLKTYMRLITKKNSTTKSDLKDFSLRSV
jgi:hypothetical protein